jgi:hypothetical protein
MTTTSSASQSTVAVGSFTRSCGPAREEGNLILLPPTAGYREAFLVLAGTPLLGVLYAFTLGRPSSAARRD